MVDEEHILGNALDVVERLDADVILEIVVDVRHELRNLGSHAMLRVQRVTLHAVRHHALEQRHREVVLLRKGVHAWVGLQLFMVPDHDQMPRSFR